MRPFYRRQPILLHLPDHEIPCIYDARKRGLVAALFKIPQGGTFILNFDFMPTHLTKSIFLIVEALPFTRT